MSLFNIDCKLNMQYCSTDSFKRSVEYKFETFSFRDKDRECIIQVSPEYYVNIISLRCTSRDEAIEASKSILEYLCKAISLLIQTISYEVREYQPNITFNNYDIRIVKEEHEEPAVIVEKSGNKQRLIVSDRIYCRDGISAIHCSYELPIKNIEVFYGELCKEDNDSEKFYIDTIYRALKCSDIESKYFTLFTIIEQIEQKYSRDEKLFKRLLSDEQKTRFNEQIGPFLEEIQLGEDELSRVKDRILGIVNSATLKSRAEKLCEILEEIYGIKNISKGLIRYDTTYTRKHKEIQYGKKVVVTCKIEQFIEARNKLFHGGNLEEEEYNKMVQLTNELLVLCEKIMLKSRVS